MRRDPADPVAAEHLAIDALANRRSPAAAPEPSAFASMTPTAQLVTVFSNCLAGRLEQAHALMALIPLAQRMDQLHVPFFEWAERGCTA